MPPPTLAGDPPPEPPGDEGDEQVAALAVFSQLALLAATLMLGHLAVRRRIYWIGEAGIALLLGLAIGLGIVLVRQGHGTYAKLIGFDKGFFLLAILPPIMFEAGHRLDVDGFFSNLDGIAAFAFAGTAISTAAMGGLVWGAGALGLCLPLPLVHALLFGSIVSATDPVTVLAVFQRLGAHPDLYALVFGESVLNDAVAMVLYRTLSRFLHAPVSAAAVVGAAVSFVGVFAGSMAVGCGTALGTAALVKSGRFRSKHAPLESSLVVLLAYGSYVLADGLGLSGIVSSLFCGVFMAKYVRPNLTPASRDRVSAFYKVVCSLAESFVFVYIGASIYMDGFAAVRAKDMLPFMAVTFGALALSRGLNIFPCAALVNCTRPAGRAIPPSQQLMLWWSGLRGAMAFAIALEAADSVPGSGQVMLSATYIVILATVLINGGSAAWMLERLQLRSVPESAFTSTTRRAIPGIADGSGELEGPEDGVEKDLLETLLTASSLALEEVEQAERTLSGGLSHQERTQQLREAIRRSGVIRQITLDNRHLSSYFLGPAGCTGLPSVQPSLAGDIASRLGSGHSLSLPPPPQQLGPAAGSREGAGNSRLGAGNGGN